MPSTRSLDSLTTMLTVGLELSLLKGAFLFFFSGNLGDVTGMWLDKSIRSLFSGSGGGGGIASLTRNSADVSLLATGASRGLIMDFLNTDRLGGAVGGVETVCTGGTVEGTGGGCRVGLGETGPVLLRFCAAACFALGAGLGKLLRDFFSGKGGGISSSVCAS